MKKLILSLVSLLAFGQAKADEGMWTLYNLPQAVFEQMQAEGYSMPYGSLYSDENAIKNACVNFSGFCSGVVVSPNGLVFTNHHCGFGAINKHSTVEHDYMRNGFYAKTYEEELPNENMFVSFMVEQKDVTNKIVGMGIHNLTPTKQTYFLDSIENAWSKEVKKNDSTLRLELKPFYEGNKYFATTYRDFTDLRLVFTVPKSMGKYGGETDNWMWPRQTCDFSVFRIYADPKTNGPAAYSKDNVPYRPKSWAPVSLQGYKEGDFSMTIGYPGTTNRYLSSYGIRERRDAQNAPRAQVRGVKQEVMIKHMRASDAVRIKYETAYAQSSNYWKNSLGMNKCIDSIGLVQTKADFEKKIAQYVDSTGFMKDKLDFNIMERLYNKRFDIIKARMYFTETFIRTNELANRAMRAHNGSAVKGKGKKQYIMFEDNSDKWDAALDKEVYAALLANYRKHVDPKYLPNFYKTIDSKFGGDYTAYVNHLYDKSLLMKNGKKIYVNKKAFKNDLAVQMGLDITEIMTDFIDPLRAINDSIKEQERYLCAAKLRMEQDMPNYSDANFTMRLSYGQVKEFAIGGKSFGYYTTASSLVDKMNMADKNVEYLAEPIMKELMSAKDFGKYADKETGTLQLCFLSNNDITGGNSGSPMFNGKGELIGLAFDGNWDSLSSGLLLDSQLARCIGVDIRFVLYMMDKWGHADRLLEEINAK
ncbi:MAG: S46 family peptidase [Prevotella sp.]|nr:S46 family peptidase [Prevotella sp.]